MGSAQRPYTSAPTWRRCFREGGEVDPRRSQYNGIYIPSPTPLSSTLSVLDFSDLEEYDAREILEAQTLPTRRFWKMRGRSKMKHASHIHCSRSSSVCQAPSTGPGATGLPAGAPHDAAVELQLMRAASTEAQGIRSHRRSPQPILPFLIHAKYKAS